MTDMMKAVIVSEYGDNAVVSIKEVPCPTPAPTEVRVKIYAAGVNPIDWKIRNGAGRRMGMTLPIALGGEISGVIDRVGAEVTNFKVGDPVYGIIKSGGFAEFATVPAAHLSPKPATLEFEASAALPLGALTAWQALFDVAGLVAGQRLLITNSSGGVGSLAVQLAKARGAHVTALASGRNADFVRGLGADTLIDYQSERFEDVAGQMDVVFDTVGGETYERAFRTVKAEGIVVTAVAFASDEIKALGIKTERVICKPNAVQLNAIRELAEAGQMVAHIARVYSLSEIRDALALSEVGHTRGKIVIKIMD